MDISGKKFGSLTAIKRIDEKKNGSYLWICKCDCGNTKNVTARDLNAGRVTSCGCKKGRQQYLAGKRFGKLTVISDTGKRQKNIKMWLCKCDCGNTTEVRTDALTSGNVISCGCVANGPEKIKLLTSSRKIADHTSPVFFKNTVSKNNTTGINGVCRLKNGKYRAYIGYKNKVYTLVEDYNISIAIMARKEADIAVKEGKFDEWISENKRGAKGEWK